MIFEEQLGSCCKRVSSRRNGLLQHHDPHYFSFSSDPFFIKFSSATRGERATAPTQTTLNYTIWWLPWMYAQMVVSCTALDMPLEIQLSAHQVAVAISMSTVFALWVLIFHVVLSDRVVMLGLINSFPFVGRSPSVIKIIDIRWRIQFLAVPDSCLRHP